MLCPDALAVTSMPSNNLPSDSSRIVELKLACVLCKNRNEGLEQTWGQHTIQTPLTLQRAQNSAKETGTAELCVAPSARINTGSWRLRYSKH